MQAMTIAGDGRRRRTWGTFICTTPSWVDWAGRTVLRRELQKPFLVPRGVLSPWTGGHRPVIVRKSRTEGSWANVWTKKKLDQLRRWGSGLAGADSEELRATGKAILLLIEEIEALHVDLWHAKAARVETAVDHERSEADLRRSLAARLHLG